MRTQGRFKGHFYPLPEGYDLLKNNKGRYVTCNRQAKRYLWCPIKGSEFYEPTTKTIYVYMDWSDTSPSGVISPDGFAKIRKLKGGKSMWVNNLEVRKAIPIVKKEI